MALKTDTELEGIVAACWPKAQAHWSRFLLLTPPVDDSEQHSVARIHLGTRQVGLHFDLLRKKDLLDCVEGILAHELGHHVRYPGTLAVLARLRLMERTLLPVKEYSLVNLFTDLLINEALGDVLGEQLMRVYQAFSGDGTWQRDPAFLFYLAVYEELWRQNPGTLMGPTRRSFERSQRDYRADAQMLAQNLFHLGPNLYTQFIYFVSVVGPYVPSDEDSASSDPYSCGCGEPAPEDWADALTPNARELEAIKRALAEGWIPKGQTERMGERMAGIPGLGSLDATLVADVMAAYYRQQAERYLLRPPPQRRLGEAVVPTTLEEWEPGDAERDIDWLATLVQRGDRLGVVQPLRRLRLAEDEGLEAPLWQPRIEIYLDVSGSMPDPRRTRNAMTLAAQILQTAAIRAGGWARAVLFSAAPVPHWEWCRSEIELSRFLMHYVGGGTVFPFALLERSVTECGSDQPIRVVITDRDFDANYDSKPQHAGIFAAAARVSPHFVLLLHRPDEGKAARYRQAGARLIAVAQMEDFPRMAADLSFALFGEQPHADL
jgi:hypothetical protein